MTPERARWRHRAAPRTALDIDLEHPVLIVRED